MRPIRISLIAHILHGIFAGVLTLALSLGPFLAIFLFAQFLLYEFVEETKIKDELYYEIQEWAFGYAIGLIKIILAKYIMNIMI